MFNVYLVREPILHLQIVIKMILFCALLNCLTYNILMCVVHTRTINEHFHVYIVVYYGLIYGENVYV